MALNLNSPQPITEMKPRIVVIGVGGAGGNAVNNMIRSNLEGVEFIVGNTDAQALEHSEAERKIQLGVNITKGLGAGARPDIGRAAAEETMEEVLGHLNGANMVFITAGMGGGTGTGAAPVIAQAARDAGILTVGVVTKPFHFEGGQRMKLAESGIEELQKYVDTLIIIPNQNLFRVANEKTTFADAFKMADDVLYSGVRGVTDLMVMPGLINLDFADIRTVMSEMGKAMMGTGESDGETRAILAAESAISNPLLEDVSMKGANGVLINITGGGDMTLFEVDEAANRIREEVDPEANIIFGSTFDEALEGKMRVSVVATGIEAGAMAAPRPVQPARRVERPAPVAEVSEPEVENPAEPMVAEVETAPVAETAAPEAPVAETETVAAEATIVEEASPEPVNESLFGSDDLPPATAPEAGAPEEDAPLIRPMPGSAEESQAATRRPKTPEAVPTRDAFIPPRPVRPEEIAQKGAETEVDAFAEAAMANGAGDSKAEKPKSRPNLFRRVTGLMGGREDAPAAAAPSQAATPPKLGTTQNESREPSSADDEMLEIPAFLRRQAN